MLVLVLVLMGLADVHGWCSRNQIGDCFLLIRAGGEPEEAINHARGIKFVHETEIGGAEHGFGHIAAIPNVNPVEAEMQFAIGSDIHATLHGNGLFRVGQMEVGSNAKPRDHAFPMTVKGPGLKLSNEDDLARIVFHGKTTSSSMEHNPLLHSFTIRSDNQVDIVAHEEVKVQGTVFSESLISTSAGIECTKVHIKPSGEDSVSQLKLDTWTVQTNEKEGFSISNHDRKVLKINEEAPKDSIILSRDGNVGIGTKWPAVKLDVNGGVQGTSAYSSASDSRYKTNVTNLAEYYRNSTLEKIKKLRPVVFEWRQEEFPYLKFPEGEQIGFIAQELETEFPQVVLTGSNGYKSVQYSSLTPVLTNAVVELATKLENENNALKAEIQTLRNRMLSMKQMEDRLQAMENMIRQMHLQLVT